MRATSFGPTKPNPNPFPLALCFAGVVLEISPQVISKSVLWIDSCLGPIVYGSSEG